ncbi:Sulfate permease [Rhizoctonia solani]|uniref:Sulfate permease n=1 Tax=Rhizoctonia solani TaxID=456999 RepID=A0A8H7IHT9_9AGAM|nr:Sulfate permease [Rhizoctonia solani]
MAEGLKRLGKRIVGYPDRPIPHTISTRDYLQQAKTTNVKQGVIDYLTSLFPFFQWITRYNLGWATGDLIRSMSYAKIATLTPEYGLYASFVGVFIYCFFATSKDVSIGPVAVMSLQVANVIKHVQNSHPNLYTGPEIAVALAFICGFIVLGIGLLRIGRIVEFIPAPAVSGFMTGSAISIVAGQVPGLFGINGRFDTRAATYKVIINTLKNLKHSTKDAAFGVTGLFALYAIKYVFMYLTKRFPNRERLFFFISIARNAFVIIVLTLAAYLYAHPRKDAKGNYPFPSSRLFHADSSMSASPVLTLELFQRLAPRSRCRQLFCFLNTSPSPSVPFGRLNGYKINPNQEFDRIGVTNTIGAVRRLPATGSFSRSALKSKSGVRTPAADGSGITVIVAFMVLPTHSSVSPSLFDDLVASPAQAFMFWRRSTLEYIIWLAAVLVTIFSSIGRGSIERSDHLSLEESITFPNSSSVNSALVDYAKENTKRGKDMTKCPRRGAQVDAAAADASKPILRAVVLDFSAVAHIDTTGVQNLMDTRKELERWADRPIEFHFASILSPWIRRALVAGGFGVEEHGRVIPHEIAPVVPPPQGQYTGPNDEFAITASNNRASKDDVEDLKSASSSMTEFEAAIVSRSTPYFHLDLTLQCALQRALLN